MSHTHHRLRSARSTRALSALVAGLVVGLVVPGTPALADSIRDDSWQVDALELPELHKITKGEGVTVAVIDTGVDASHPDLKGNVLPGVDLYDEKTKGRVDRTGHGTSMASLIAGHGHGPGGRNGVLGVAPKAKILPISVQPTNTGIIPPDGIAVAIDWAVDHGADVINVSLSSSSNSNIDRAVERAYEKSVIVVASAGNKSQSIVVGAPATNSDAIAVTGSDRKGKLGPESLRGIDNTIDITAPSVDLISATKGGRYATATGVSGATALVSGAVALIRSKYPDLNAFRTFERLLWTTKDAGEPGKDPDFGWGLLDLRRALTGQPDDRGKKSPSPSAEAAAPEPESSPKVHPSFIIAMAVIVLVVVALIVLSVRAVRRRRARRAGGAVTAEATTLSLDPTPGNGPSGPAPSADQSAGTAGTGENSAWQRPADPGTSPRD